MGQIAKEPSSKKTREELIREADRTIEAVRRKALKALGIKIPQELEAEIPSDAVFVKLPWAEITEPVASNDDALALVEPDTSGSEEIEPEVVELEPEPESVELEDIPPAVEEPYSTLPPTPSPVLSPPPPTPPEEETVVSQENVQKGSLAFLAARERIIEEADEFILEAYGGTGLDQFSCRLMPGNGKYIELTMANLQGERQKHLLDVNGFTLEEMALLKIAVQSHILNESGIRALLDRSGAHASVLIDQILPYYAGDPKKRKITLSSSNGLLSLNIEAPDLDEEEIVHISLPLWLADTEENRTAGGEAEYRQLVVEAFIEDSFKRRERVSKRDVLDYLEDDILARKARIDSPEEIDVPGYEVSQELNFPSIDSDSKQITYLSPTHVTRGPGGLNPSWVLRFSFRVREEKGDLQSHHIRGRAMNLHTTNKTLAMARANMAMVQVMKFIDGMSKEKPARAWALEPHRFVQSGVQLVRDPEACGKDVGLAELCRYIDEMTRYEDDVALSSDHEITAGMPATFNLQVMRGIRNASLEEPYNLKLKRHMPDSTVEPYCVERRTAEYVPLYVRFDVSAKYAEAIPEFVQQVNGGFVFAIGEHYSSIALADDSEEEEKPKHVPKYRTVTTVNLLREAVESHIGMLGQDVKITNSWDDSPAARQG